MRSLLRCRLKELVYTRFRCRTDPEPAIKAHVDATIKCLSDDRVVEQILARRSNSRESCESRCFGGTVTAQKMRSHHLLQGQIRAL